MSNASTSSGLKVASGAIMTMPGKLMGLQGLADNTNAATIIVYDSPDAASGVVLAKIVVDATTTYEDAHIPDGGIAANQGLYLSISGTGAEAVVWFQLG